MLLILANVPPSGGYVIVTQGLPDWEVNVLYPTTQLVAVNGNQPYTWTFMGLPDGLTGGTDGTVSGIPLTASTFTISVICTDSSGLIATANFTVNIWPELKITTASLPAGTQGTPYSQTLAATGGLLPYTWSLASDSNPLPPGLSLNATTGVISGTPSAGISTTCTFQVIDALSGVAQAALSMTINSPPSITTASPLPNATISTSYSTTLAVSGGTSPYTWSIFSGSLPAGLSLASSTGIISGTAPATTSINSIVFQVTDTNGAAFQKTLSLSVVSGSSGQRTLLQSSNFTYIGSFNIPWKPFTNIDTSMSGNPICGIAVRWVSGTLNMICKSAYANSPAGTQQQFFEFAVPTLKTTTPYNYPSTGLVNWGKVTDGAAYLYNNNATQHNWNNGSVATGGGNNPIYGIYWDPVDSRLYATFGQDYSVGGATADPSLCFVTLTNPVGPVTSSYGPWRFKWPKQARGGVTGIPTWYANAYLNGQRLGIGFGGGYSVIGAGHGGYGATFFAFNPPPASNFSPVLGAGETGSGQSYTLVPTVVITDTGGGTGASATATISGGQVTGVTVNSGGSGYTAATTVTFSGGGTGKYAAAQPVISGGVITAIQLLSTSATGGTFPTYTDAGGTSAPYLNTTLLTATNSFQGTGVLPNLGLRSTDSIARIPTLALQSTSTGGLPGNVVSATSTTVTLKLPPQAAASTYAAANSMAGFRVGVTSSGGVYQERTILTHAGLSTNNLAYSNITITVDSAWTTTPDNTYTFQIWKCGGTGKVVSVPSSTTFTTSGFDKRLWGNNATSNLGANNGYYNGQICYIIAGTGSGQSQVVQTYTYSGGVGTFTFASPWGTPLDTTSVFAIDGPRFHGVTQSATATTIVLDSHAPATNNDLNLKDTYGFNQGVCVIKMLTGTGAGQQYQVSNYVPGTSTATLGNGQDASGNLVTNGQWVTIPSNGDYYQIEKVVALGGVSAFWATTTREYQTWVDTYFANGCWIDTGTKHGLFFFPIRGIGYSVYFSASVAAESYKTTMQCFDPMQLPCVTGGAQPDAAWEMDMNFPGLNTVGGVLVGSPNGKYGTSGPGLPPCLSWPGIQGACGVAYDPVNSWLFIAVGAQQVQLGGSESTPTVHVYSVV